MSGRGRRRYAAAAPVPVLIVLAVVLVVLVVLDRRAGTADASPAPGSSGASRTGAAPAGGGAALAVGPGPQQSYAVHDEAPPGSCHYRYERARPLPDPACTPGAVSPAVTPATIDRTVCARGYTGGVRPPRNVTDREKRLSALAYGYRGSFATAEYDHLVPLGIGGDPNDARNLWVQPNEDPNATTNANTKDDVESTLHDAVCAHRVGLAEAQRAIATDWVTALAVLGLA